MKNILIFLSREMDRPHSYGWFHFLFLFLVVILSIMIIKKHHDDEKVGKKILFILAIISLLFELYKQVIFSFNYDINYVWWKYQWYAFPFQFCSTPMYIGFIFYFVKNKKIKNSLLLFLATYGLLGGIITYVYPESCFTNTIGINIQTMVHHGSMILMGITAINCFKLKFDLKQFISAFKVFMVLVSIALFINIITYYLKIDNGLEMFFISPFHNCSLPILSSIDEKLPYIPFLLIYLLSFSFAGIIVTYFVKLIKKN